MTGIEFIVVFCLVAVIGFAWSVLADMGHVEPLEVRDVPLLEAADELI
ncbi:MAG: hypothetical protein HKN07_08925 [Acidimicrobiia bacterium]|nr:hypothetical protein [Acidimicrobiia bacterium]